MNISSRVFLFLFLVVPLTLFGYDDSPKCFKEIQRNFFQHDSVLQAFSLYRVPTGEMNPIYNDLQNRARIVPSLVSERARRMKPNPIENPFDAEGAKSILLSVLYEAFYETMRENNVSNNRDIRRMFDYMINQQEARLNSCLQIEEKIP